MLICAQDAKIQLNSYKAPFFFFIELLFQGSMITGGSCVTSFDCTGFKKNINWMLIIIIIN